MHTNIEDFPVCDARGYGREARGLLHGVRTDLDAFTEGEIACLVNHGYSLSDAALRSRAPELCPIVDTPFRWPHAEWSDEGKVEAALADSHRRKLIRTFGRYLVGRTPRWKPTRGREVSKQSIDSAEKIV